MSEDLVIADCETDGLLPEMTKLHCLQIGSENGDDVTLYGDNDLCDRPLAEGQQRLREAKRVVFHNGLGFDFHAINHFLPGTLEFPQIVDTLLLARMKHPEERRHSLRDWGLRTGTHKGDYKGDFQVFDEEFARYSRDDIPAGRALWHKVKDVLPWGKTPEDIYWTEARAMYCVALQEQSGFQFDVAKAQELHGELTQELDVLRRQLREMFPAFSREFTFVPKVNSKKFGYVKGEPFTKRWSDEFNPRSRQMIAEALIREGWEPIDVTPTGQPKVDEKTLRTIDHPGAKLLIEYLSKAKLVGALMGEKVGKGYLQLVKPDGRIHGRVSSIGAVTWRMAHSNPNTANVDKKDHRVRELFTCRPGFKLVGVDGAEIQARGLAHYLEPYDKGAYRDKLLKGDKKAGTDGHSMNLKALQPFGMVSRDGSKTGLYARIFGCSFKRMLVTINEDRVANGEKPFEMRHAKRIGQGAINALGQSMPGLNELMRDVQSVGKARGYLIGCDGARVPVAAPHAALVSLLQHLEARIMKRALGQLHFEEAPKRGWVYGRDFTYSSNVHDEVQSEVRADLAEEYGAVFSECIAEAARRMGLRCPFAGEAKVGDNWHITH